MKTIMYWIIGIILALGLLMQGIRLLPKGQAMVGLTAGHLRPCPDTPNCVCSEDMSSSSRIAPFVFNDTAEAAWLRAREAVLSAGGTIQTEEPAYLWASFTTKWLHFVDDVELRMDAGHHIIHVRSASRVGHSDFGVNRKRVERLRTLFDGAPSGQRDEVN